MAGDAYNGGVSPSQNTMEQKNAARDVFLYLLVIITLGISAGNLWAMLFQYVNIYVPDPDIVQCYGSGCRDAIRWTLASLIVVFPVFLWVWRFLQRDLKQNPEKADSRVRRWLLYLTLFVAGVIIIGDTVALVWNWLQGELKLQIFLKLVAVAYITGSIFYYFLKALNPKGKHYARIVGWVAVVVVVASVVLGLITAGMPSQVRAERMDNQRIIDLQGIQSTIVYTYWQSKARLPDRLSDLEDSISGYIAPMDPVSKLPYEYIRKTDRSFVLCAEFATEQYLDPSGRESYPAAQNDIWSHGTGRTCFDRVIDPEIYRIKEGMILQ